MINGSFALSIATAVLPDRHAAVCTCNVSFEGLDAAADARSKIPRLLLYRC